MHWSRKGRYSGAEYKDHFACFQCRKMVRKPSHHGLLADGRTTMRFEGTSCAECGQPLRDMGKAFRPPRQTAITAWRKIERQYQRGWRWSSSRW